VGNIPWNKGKKAPQISIGKTGIKFTKEHKKNLSKSWDYKKHITSKRNEAISEGLKKAYLKGTRIVWNKGKNFHTKEHKEKMSKKMKGHSNFNTELKGCFKKGHPGMPGEKNPNWNDGSSFEPYDKNFNNKFKKFIRKRDNQICMMCGKHREQLKKALSIHHINYDKTLTIPQNCISLCNHCHMITNFNRSDWISFFQNLLSDRYGYQYKFKNIILELK